MPPQWFSIGNGSGGASSSWTGPTVGNYTLTTGSSSSLTAPLPNGVTNGDIIVLAALNTTSSFTGGVSTFTKQAQVEVTQYWTLYTKTAASEPSDYSLTSSGTIYVAYVIDIKQNTAKTCTFDAAIAFSSTCFASAAAFTDTFTQGQANELLICVTEIPGGQNTPLIVGAPFTTLTSTTSDGYGLGYYESPTAQLLGPFLVGMGGTTTPANSALAIAVAGFY